MEGPAKGAPLRPDHGRRIKCGSSTGIARRRPETMFPRIADVLGEMALAARKGKDLPSHRRTKPRKTWPTSAELAGIMKVIGSKGVGMNWDPHNAYGRETSFPDGYALLPKEAPPQRPGESQGGGCPTAPKRKTGRPSCWRWRRTATRAKSRWKTHIFRRHADRPPRTKSMDEIHAYRGEI